jgi:hypothetical protein
MATAEDKDEKPDAPIPRPKQPSRQKSPPPAEEEEEDEVKLTPEEEAVSSYPSIQYIPSHPLRIANLPIPPGRPARVADHQGRRKHPLLIRRL